MQTYKPKTIDNFVDTEYQNSLYKKLTHVNFPWAFMADTTDELSENNSVMSGSTPAFGNLYYWNRREENPDLEMFKPLLDAIPNQFGVQVDKLLRIRIGFLLNTAYALPSMPYKHNTPHVDYDQEHFTMTYYVNNTDGDTIVFHETQKSDKYYPLEKCSPKKGRAFLFNGKHYHASTCPKMFTTRIVVTVNFVGSVK